jgi:hypothetical protein
LALAFAKPLLWIGFGSTFLKGGIFSEKKKGWKKEKIEKK